MLTLRELTGVTKACSVWEMPDGSIRFVKNTQAEYDNKGQGEIPGRPDRNARFIRAGGGIPAINTPTGWPEVDDCWEVLNEDTGLNELIVSRSDTGVNYHNSTYIADTPVNGRSNIAGLDVESSGNKEVFKTYDLAMLADVVPTKVPANTRRVISGQIDNHRSVTFDAATQDQQDPGANLTTAHTTTTEDNRYISVHHSLRGSNFPTGVTYNAVSLGDEVQVDNGGHRSSYFDLVAPATGTNNIISTFDSTSMVMGIWTAYGVDQSTPRSAQESALGSGTGPTDTIASAIGELVLVGIGWIDNGALTQDAGFVDDWNHLNVGGNNRGGAGAHIAGASSITYTGTLAGAENWGVIMTSLAAVLIAVAVPETEEIAEALSVTRQITPNAPDTEAITEATLRARALSRFIAETESLAENTLRTLQMFREVGEQEELSEANLAVLGMTRANPETEELAEAILFALGRTRTVGEQETIAEAVSQVLGRIRVSADTASIAEAVVIALGLVRDAQDTLEMAEATVATRAMTRMVNETLALAEAVQRPRVMIRPINEVLEAAEQVIKSAALVRLVVNQLALAEGTVAFLPGALVAIIDLTMPARSLDLTAPIRSLDLTAPARSLDLVLAG